MMITNGKMCKNSLPVNGLDIHESHHKVCYKGCPVFFSIFASSFHIRRNLEVRTIDNFNSIVI